MAHTFKGATPHHRFFKGFFTDVNEHQSQMALTNSKTKRKTGKKTELIAKDENSHDDKCDNDNEDKQINFLCSGL